LFEPDQPSPKECLFCKKFDGRFALKSTKKFHAFPRKKSAPTEKDKKECEFFLQKRRMYEIGEGIVRDKM
jgi:hypothetical protein